MSLYVQNTVVYAFMLEELLNVVDFSGLLDGARSVVSFI